MPFIAAQRLILAVLVLSAALTATSPHATEAPPSLKGQFLIATPAMRDPRFDHAVILMVRHDSDGALGIVINRPLGEKPLTDLLAVFGNKDATASGNVRIFLGGPVQPEVSFVIHGADYRRAETLDIDARLAATPSSAVLPDMARSAGPTKSLIAFGYAGWDPALVFDDDRDKVWEHATARRTQDL